MQVRRPSTLESTSGWQGTDAWTGVPALPPRAPQCSDHVMSWDGIRGNAQCRAVWKGLRLPVLTPAAHSISQSVWTSGPFPLWDAACHGKRFQKLHESLFQQTKCHHGDKQMSPNVTTVTSRLLHAFCITRDASRALTVFPHRRVSTGNGLQRFPLWKINRQPWPF